MRKLYRWVLSFGGGRHHYMAHYNLARNLHEHGKYEEAVEYYRLAIELKPDYCHAYNNLGVVLCLMGQYEESEAAYRQALEIENYFNPHNNLGDLYLRLGRLEEAEAEVLIALEIKPDSVGALHTCTRVLVEMGRLAEAEERFRQCLTLDSNDIVVLEDLSEFLKHQHREEEAEKLRSKARKLKEVQKWKCDGLQEWRDRSEAYSQRNRGKKKHVS